VLVLSKHSLLVTTIGLARSDHINHFHCIIFYPGQYNKLQVIFYNGLRMFEEEKETQEELIFLAHLVETLIPLTHPTPAMLSNVPRATSRQSVLIQSWRNGSTGSEKEFISTGRPGDEVSELSLRNSANVIKDTGKIGKTG
jgi:hypothetical protein